MGKNVTQCDIIDTGHVRQRDLQIEVTGSPLQAVMLGHMSPQRNTGEIAMAEVKQTFAERGVSMDFELLAAPLREASNTIEIMPASKSCPV